MTLQELRYFVALANHKHFGKAAKACHVSQPTLSVAIQKLEETLGVTLFERYKSSVEITQVGEQLLEKAKQVLRDSDDFVLLAKQHQDPLSGVLRLGCIYTIGPYLLPSLLPKLRKAAPDMPLEIQEDFTHQLREKLLDGKLDVIILAEPFTAKNTLKKKLYDEGFVVLLPKAHALAKQKSIKPADLQGETIMLLGEGHCFRDNVLAACPNCYVDRLGEANGIRATTFEGASLETIRSMVATGMGITVLPQSAAHLPSYLKSTLTTVPLQSQQAKREVVMVWREQFPRLKAIHAVERVVKQSALRPLRHSQS